MFEIFVIITLQKRPDPVKGKILELIQVWSHAFRNEASYKIVQDTFHLMKMEGECGIQCCKDVLLTYSQKWFQLSLHDITHNPFELGENNIPFGWLVVVCSLQKSHQLFYHIFVGYQFPTLKEADAMFMAEKAPEWKDGETCHRCRVQFSTFQRKVRQRNSQAYLLYNFCSNLLIHRSFGTGLIFVQSSVPLRKA